MKTYQMIKFDIHFDGGIDILILIPRESATKTQKLSYAINHI